MIIPIWLKAALAAAIIAVIAGAGWFAYDSIYDRGYDAAKAEWKEAAAQANAAARTKEQAINKQLQEAQHAATKRETILRADADRARAAAIGLRDELAEFRRQLPSLAEQAVRQYADAASVVFAECVAEYQALAEQTGRIDSDRQKLEDAWPG